MVTGTRPGGLTALAVFNFVFGAFSLLAALGVAVLALSGGLGPAMSDPAVREWIEKTGTATLLVLSATGALTAALEIVSGIGYLLQKRVLGRLLGNIFAVASIAGNLFELSLETPQGTRPALITFIAGMVYPLITLYLINVTFRKDFIR